MSPGPKFDFSDLLQFFCPQNLTVAFWALVLKFYGLLLQNIFRPKEVLIKIKFFLTLALFPKLFYCTHIYTSDKIVSAFLDSKRLQKRFYFQRHSVVINFSAP